MTANIFKEGFVSGVTEAPRPITPEQEEAAARKLERSRALRAEKRAKGELAPIGDNGPESADTLATGKYASGPVETEALSASVSSENVEKVSGPLAVADDGMTAAEQALAEATMALAAERADLMARASALHLEERYTYGADTSIKWLRSKVADAETDQRTERADAGAPPPPDDAAYHDAEQRYHDAQHRLTTLQAEQAGIQGQIQDAVASGDFGAVATLRARQAALPWLIEVAQLDAAKLAVPLAELRMALTRHQKKAARVATSERRAEIEKLQADLWAIVNGEAAADSEHADAVSNHGQALDRLRQLEAQMMQPAPAQHRAPHGLS